MNNNLLNNQNYILGKTEKKKLLWKFFVGKNMRQIYILFSKLDPYLKYSDTQILLYLYGLYFFVIFAILFYYI